jgi:hypothetical protein
MIYDFVIQMEGFSIGSTNTAEQSCNERCEQVVANAQHPSYFRARWRSVQGQRTAEIKGNTSKSTARFSAIAAL